MNYEESILNAIIGKLTGDQQKDTEMLKSEYEFYKKIPNSEIILRGISEFICTIVPYQNEEKIQNAIKNKELSLEQALKIVESDLSLNKVPDAEIILKVVINEYEKLKLYKNTEEIEYRSFNNLFEEIIHKNINKPTKKVINVKENFSHMYLLYSQILILKNDYTHAMKYLKKAAAWNPVDVNIIFNCCEIFKSKGEMEKLLNMTKLALKYAFKRNDIGKCYRNLGYYYIDKNNFEMGIVLYLLSFEYDPDNADAKKELDFIQKQTNLNINLPSIENVIIMLNKEDIQFGVSNVILELSYTYGKHCVDIYNDKLGCYFYNIFYNLTKNSDVKKIIDDLNKY